MTEFSALKLEIWWRTGRTGYKAKLSAIHLINPVNIPYKSVQKLESGEYCDTLKYGQVSDP